MENGAISYTKRKDITLRLPKIFYVEPKLKIEEEDPKK